MDGLQVPSPSQSLSVCGHYCVFSCAETICSAHSINHLEFWPADSRMPPKLPFVTPNVVSASVLNDCYGEYHGGYHGYHGGYHHHPPPPQVSACPPCPACSPCPACTMISMSSSTARPNTLPGIQTLQWTGGGDHHLSPVHMHPDPHTITHHRHHHRDTGVFLFYFCFCFCFYFCFSILVVDLEPHPHSQNYASWPASRPVNGPNNISIRRKNFQPSAGKLRHECISVTVTLTTSQPKQTMDLLSICLSCHGQLRARNNQQNWLLALLLDGIFYLSLLF